MRNCSNMASSLPSVQHLLPMPSVKQSLRPSLQIRAQGFKNEGIDANMSILRERIEEVGMKERLERCFKSENGWNYATGYSHKHKKTMDTYKFFENFGMAFGPFCLTIGTGTLCLCIFSLFVHSCQ